jgi:hypothetical protein
LWRAAGGTTKSEKSLRSRLTPVLSPASPLTVPEKQVPKAATTARTTELARQSRWDRRPGARMAPARREGSFGTKVEALGMTLA